MKKLFVLSFVAAIALSATIIMAQGANQQISIQGRLTDATGKPLDGSYVAKFDLFDAETGGSSLWSETQSIAVSKGLFQTRLASVYPFPSGVKFDKPYYVEITVNNEKLSPRYVLTASPYTLSTPVIPTTFDASQIVSGTLNLHRMPVISTSQIADGAISGEKIQNGAVNKNKILKGGDANALYETIYMDCTGTLDVGNYRGGMFAICSSRSNTAMYVSCEYDAANSRWVAHCWDKNGNTVGGTFNMLLIRAS